jgi:uncharacterized protein YndB with AHSA1/START domain
MSIADWKLGRRLGYSYDGWQLHTLLGEELPMVKKILLAIVALVAVLVVVVALQPADFTVERSATMAAPPEKVFAQVNDFHNWEAWSPWAKLDPNAKNSFEGPTSGEGAIFKWAGNDQVGEGAMKITESKPNELIKIKLDFIKPFAGTSLTEFAFKPIDDQTKVTWTMTGHNDFMGKAFCLVMNGKKMMGGEFEKGLASMKVLVEEKPATGEEPTEAADADGATKPAPTEGAEAAPQDSEPASTEAAK